MGKWDDKGDDEGGNEGKGIGNDIGNCIGSDFDPTSTPSPREDLRRFLPLCDASRFW